MWGWLSRSPPTRSRGRPHPVASDTDMAGVGLRPSLERLSSSTREWLPSGSSAADRPARIKANSEWRERAASGPADGRPEAGSRKPARPGSRDAAPGRRNARRPIYARFRVSIGPKDDPSSIPRRIIPDGWPGGPRTARPVTEPASWPWSRTRRSECMDRLEGWDRTLPLMVLGFCPRPSTPTSRPWSAPRRSDCIHFHGQVKNPAP